MGKLLFLAFSVTLLFWLWRRWQRQSRLDFIARSPMPRSLRPQLIAPPVLADALRHGIFQERQAEFVTDALRAQLLECAGYRTKVFEFISTEHTAKNLMIAAIRRDAPADPLVAKRAREFAAFYGIRRQRLAEHLGVPISPGT